MKPSIYPLYAPADQSRVQPILEALKRRGATVRDGARGPRSRDILLMFLSEAVRPDGPQVDAFFRYSLGRDLIVPVALDDAQPPEALRIALMARHTLTAARYSPDELADRILPRRLMPRLLPLGAAALLLAVGGLALWKLWPRQASAPAAEVTTAPATEAPATPEPLPTPQMPFYGVDLDAITEIVCVGDRIFFYTFEEGVSPNEPAPRRGWEDVAYGGWVGDGIHFYSKEDGSEYPHEVPVDLAWLTMLPNLQYLSLCDVSAELPDLSSLKRLDRVHLGYGNVPGLEGLRGSAITEFEYHGAGVEDFSPLTDCLSLRYGHLDLVGSRRVDLSGFHPPALQALGLGSGYQLEGVDLSCLRQCPRLSELLIDGYPQIRDLSFLSDAGALKQLTLQNMSGLRTLFGLEGLGSLEVLDINDCPDLRDISALSGCLALRDIQLRGASMHGLRDVSVLGALPHLRSIHLWAPNLQNLDFLRALPAGTRLSFSCNLGRYDCSGLEAIDAFADLSLTCYERPYAAAAPYLQGKTVERLSLYGAAELDLSTLPRVTQALDLTDCGIHDLVGIGDRVFTELRLYDCQQLTSLKGMDELPILGKRLSALSVAGCPRLTDWSALLGKRFQQISLRGVFTLPIFAKLTVSHLWLESIEADVLPDLSCLAMLDGKQRCSFSILGMDQITDLSPLSRFRGDLLEVPPQLEDQARELVEDRRFNRYNVVYPDGSWQPDTRSVTLLSWDELSTLPKAVLKRVRSLTIAGDTLVNGEATEVWEDWRDGCPVVVLRDRATDEETIVNETGTILTDLSPLARLTGLEELTLLYQPLTDLDGIQALEGLQNLEVKYSPAFTDASAAFTIQTLERLCFSHTELASLQGVQNLPELRELYIDDTRVTDFSPLSECPEELQVIFDLPKLMTVEELRALPPLLLRQVEDIAVAGDWAFRQWDPWWMGTDDRGDGVLAPTLFKNGSGEKMAVETGHITDLGELAFLPNLRRLALYCQPISDLSGAAALENLESIDLGYCDRLTDASPLFALENLRGLNFNDTHIASLEGIERMPRLTSLAIACCDVVDIRPLARVDYAFCLQEKNGGGFDLEVMKPREDPVFTAEDYAPLAAIPAFRRLNVSWVPAELWLDAVKDVPVQALSAQCGGLDSNEALRAFAAAHPELKEIQLTFDSGITDIRCLLDLPCLTYVEVHASMDKAIASLGTGFGFMLNIRED